MTRIPLIALALLILAPPSTLGAATVESAKEAERLKENEEAVFVKASGQTLADTLEALVERLPALREVQIYHRANTKGELAGRPLKHLSALDSLESLKFTGDPALSDSDFADIGKLKSLKSLHLSLP